MDIFWKRLFGKTTNRLWSGLALCLILLAIGADHLTPNDPLAVNTDLRFRPPESQYWMGTDNLGRDIGSRVIAGTRLALGSAAIILLSASLIGILVGSLAGYYGGWIDEIFMRLSDILIAFPGLVLAMAIAAALGPNLTNALAAISMVWWPQYARLVRAQVLSIKTRDYIAAALSLGASDGWVLLRHVLPNLVTPFLVQITSDIGPALVTSSSLSFIGMGAQPPTPEWGAMVSLGRRYLLDYWWMSTFPGAAIFLTVLIFNGVGEALRDAIHL